VARADYGIDAPGVVRNLALFGLLGLALGIASLFIPVGWLAVVASLYGLWAGGFLLLAALLMVLSSKLGKRRFREHLVARLGLRGDEAVLDVGCGRGLVLNGAARRLTTGHAVGLDLWSGRDQSGNAPQAAAENSRREGVKDKVRLATGDMTAMPFRHAQFDAAVSNLAVHNVPGVAARADAIRECARVVKPGGLLAIADFQKTAEYAATLRALGWTDVRRTRPSAWIFPPVRTVLARRPSSAGAAAAPPRPAPGRR
jgi:SAM-dependent methyltransferase